MIDPLFFLGLSILFVAVSLAAVLVVALPALQELARAARSAEKLFDTLTRELPPTLEAIRLTGMEISELTDDVTDGVKNAGQTVKQVNQSLDGARKQAEKVQVTTRSVVTGVKTAWTTFTQRKPKSPASSRRTPGRLPPTARPPLDLPPSREVVPESTNPTYSEGTRESLRSSETPRRPPAELRGTQDNPPKLDPPDSDTAWE